MDAAVVHVADAEAEIADSRLPKPIDNLKKAADISAAFFVCQSVLLHSSEADRNINM